ncbi:MAG: hypothetical protein ABIH63_01245 [archaeon]
MKHKIVILLFAALLVVSAVGAAVMVVPETNVYSNDAMPAGVWYVTYHGRNAYPTTYFLFSSDYYNRYGGYYRYHDSFKGRYYYRYYNDDYDINYYDDNDRRYYHYFYYD